MVPGRGLGGHRDRGLGGGNDRRQQGGGQGQGEERADGGMGAWGRRGRGERVPERPARGLGAPRERAMETGRENAEGGRLPVQRGGGRGEEIPLPPTAPLDSAGHGAWRGDWEGDPDRHGCSLVLGGGEAELLRQLRRAAWSRRCGRWADPGGYPSQRPLRRCGSEPAPGRPMPALRRNRRSYSRSHGRLHLGGVDEPRGPGCGGEVGENGISRPICIPST